MSWHDYFENFQHILALPLADRYNGVNRIIGSATLVLPGVFLTAKHMLEDYMLTHENIDIAARDWIPQDLDGTFELDVLHIMKDKRLLVWHIHKVHHIENADLVLLVASGYTGSVTPEMIEQPAHPKIDLHFPPIGSQITSIGYPETQNDTEPGTTRTLHRLNMKTTTGVVEDIDTSTSNFLRSPRLQSNAEVDGGMSGGPAVNQAGVLFGVNSSAMPPTEEYSSYTSFITPIWTAMPIKIRISLDKNESELTETSLLELAREGYIQVTGIGHIIKTTEGDLQFNTRDVKCADCP